MNTCALSLFQLV